MEPKQMNALVLAYIGDGVLEVCVRDYLVTQKMILKPNLLQKEAVTYVSAAAQASFMKEAKNHDWLTEEEWSYYRRGRNSKGRGVNKNSSVALHNESSGFEAVMGALHLEGKDERIDEIFDLYKQFIEGGNQ